MAFRTACRLVYNVPIHFENLIFVWVVKIARYQGARLGLELAADIQATLLGGGAVAGPIDLDALCIIPGRQCWVVNIDVLVLHSSGNLTDTCMMAVKAALRDTALPAVTVVRGDGGEEDEIQISDDPADAKLLSALWDSSSNSSSTSDGDSSGGGESAASAAHRNNSNIPILFSLVKIGDQLVVDPSLEEEECMTARIRFVVVTARKSHRTLLCLPLPFALFTISLHTSTHTHIRVLAASL